MTVMKVIASHNGLKAAEAAYAALVAGQPSLDACVAGVTLVEDDPDELTVGYGGLPNEDGVVELDAAVMDGPAHRGGAVAGLRGIRHPTRVAQLVMQQTKRVLLVGQGALDFALANGFVPEDLTTPRSRAMWLYWKRRRSSLDDWLAPPDQPELELQQWFEKHFYQPEAGGTVHCAARNAAGDLACATSTSGHAFKLAGRVGDSPILGAGLYVDNHVGSCGSIGHGEANLENLSSYAVVEQMRAGMSPAEAGLEILQRVAERCHPYERNAAGRPHFNLQLFIMSAAGEHAGVSLWPGKQIAVTDHAGTRLEACVPLYRE